MFRTAISSLSRQLARPVFTRALSTTKLARPIPAPRDKIADHKTFLTAIGRGCESLGEKIKDWQHLFTVTSNEMRHELGFTPQQRRWILNWTEKYRQGVNPYLITKPDKRLRSKKKRKPRK
ncbi:IGR protein motif-domain-containing protein [Syncephalis fuscata]|nr:IGR protein motif-domain-containing protein [Syncephalis fuscata]